MKYASSLFAIFATCWLIFIAHAVVYERGQVAGRAQACRNLKSNFQDVERMGFVLTPEFTRGFTWARNFSFMLTCDR